MLKSARHFVQQGVSWHTYGCIHKFLKAYFWDIMFNLFEDYFSFIFLNLFVFNCVKVGVCFGHFIFLSLWEN